MSIAQRSENRRFNILKVFEGRRGQNDHCTARPCETITNVINTTHNGQFWKVIIEITQCNCLFIFIIFFPLSSSDRPTKVFFWWIKNKLCMFPSKLYRHQSVSHWWSVTVWLRYGTVPYDTVPARYGNIPYKYRTGTVRYGTVRYGTIRYRHGTVPGTVLYRYQYRYCTVTVPVRYVIKKNLEKWYGIRIILYVKCASIVCPVTGFQNTCTSRK